MTKARISLGPTTPILGYEAVQQWLEVDAYPEGVKLRIYEGDMVVRVMSLSPGEAAVVATALLQK